ncbi:hypothetical protein CC1G_13374 [Coprinopsis cinerea okayama7|uniref:Uncharacterized protein n=1 Tax=Coprinopsis cinerea (strain Okayama-7 / 130 / ATCC MYA-4618 / FGSC 9003) TaxID=240176 RepID=A8PIN2_COPC7|nr:hypothetical protein CC1G_13374 [Coprinopsis cinerea okayama7\|eukprot:XP_001841598.2 hypothetical protein CC1G_13374 [Coprinopsis cinerea okayama7\
MSRASANHVYINLTTDDQNACCGFFLIQSSQRCDSHTSPSSLSSPPTSPTHPLPVSPQTKTLPSPSQTQHAPGGTTPFSTSDATRISLDIARHDRTTLMTPGYRWAYEVVEYFTICVRNSANQAAIVTDNAIGLGALGVLTVCCREPLCLGGTNIVMGTSPTSGSGVPLDLRIAGWGNFPC